MPEQRYLYFPPNDVDPAARALIKHKAKKLVGSYGFTPADRDDLEQELALRAHVASTQFDPARGTPKAFYNRVLQNQADTLARQATCRKRDRRSDVPLDDLRVVTADPRLDLKLYVADALAALGDDDRSVAARLAPTRVAAIARETGLTRGTVRGAKARIAGALAARNLVPISRGEQPFSEPTAYVFGNGTFQFQSRRPSGPKGKALAALRPTRGTCPAHAAAEEGAPPCPRP